MTKEQKEVKKKELIEKLWAQYGRGYADRERLEVMLNQKIAQLRNIHAQIVEQDR